MVEQTYQKSNKKSKSRFKKNRLVQFIARRFVLGRKNSVKNIKNKENEVMDMNCHLMEIEKVLQELGDEAFLPLKEEIFEIALKKHIEELEYEVKKQCIFIFEEYKQEGIKFLKTSSTIEDIKKNETIKEYGYNWVYWCEYVKGNKIPIMSMKNYFAFKNNISNSKILFPIKCKMKCIYCDGISEYIYTEEIITSKCLACGHKENVINPKNDGMNMTPNIIECDCSVCKNKRKNIFDKIQDEFGKIIKKIEEDIEQRYKQFHDKKENIGLNSRKCELDYRLYSSSLTKNEREVLSYQPTNTKELFEIVEILARKNKKNKSYKEKLMDRLKEHGVVNTVYEHESIDILKQTAILTQIGRTREDLIDGFGGKWNDDNESKKNAEKLLNILKYGTEEEFYKCIKGKNKVFFTILGKWEGAKTNVMFPRFFEKNSFEIKPKEKNELNQFYLKNSDIDPCGFNTQNLFNSDAEKAIHTVFRNEYPNAIIIPNKKLSHIISILDIKQFFDKEEVDYLMKCLVDFAIYNLEGELIKIIELQKGEHHNEDEWILKDRLKKQACRRCGIIMDEYF